MKNKKAAQIMKKAIAHPAVIAAIIALIGTILAATITSYSQYWSTKTQVEKPISYTQTAESLLYLQTLTPSSSSQISDPSLSPINRTPSMLAWQDLMEYKVFVDPCSPSNAQVVLESERWTKDTKLTVQAVENTLNNPGTSTSAIVPADTNEPFEHLFLDLSIHSLVTSSDWIKLDKNVNIIVKPLSLDTPELIHAFYPYSGCGGGDKKDFSNIVKLQTGFNEYKTSVSNDTYDFLTLQPGEYDEYRFSFSCAEPGIYRVILEQDYTYQGAPGTLVNEDIPLIYCPKSLQIWTVDAPAIKSNDGIFHVENNSIWPKSTYLLWNGTGYSVPSEDGRLPTPIVTPVPLNLSDPNSIVYWLAYDMTRGETTSFNQVVTNPSLGYGTGFAGGRDSMAKITFLTALEERIMNKPTCVGYTINEDRTYIQLWTKDWKPPWEFHGEPMSEEMTFQIFLDRGRITFLAYFTPSSSILDLDLVEYEPCPLFQQP